MAEHGVELVQLGGAALEVFDPAPGRPGQLGELRIVMRQEFVQRRIE